MALYEIEAPNGQLLQVEGDAPPTEEEARDIFIQTIGGSEDKPINDSPLSSGQRVALSFGTKEGNLNYLSENFEQAMFDPQEPDKYLVKQNGLWHKVDEEGFTFGDVQDTIGKGITVASSVLGEGLGGLAGTAIAPGAGTVGGVVAGGGVGGAGGEFLRQKIGQKLGTVSEEELNKQEVALEGVLGSVGAGLGVAISRFGKEGFKQAVKQLPKTRVPRAISGLWDRTIGVADGTIDTALKYTDDVLDFKAQTAKAKGSVIQGSKKSLEIADDIVKFTKDNSAKLKQIKRAASQRAAETGAYVSPDDIMKTVIDDTTGETLDTALTRLRVGAPDTELGVNSPMLNKLSNFLKKETLSFDDIDTAIGQIDTNVKYGSIPDKEKVAEGALKKIRVALKKQRNLKFGVEEQFDEMSNLINSVQDADGKKIVNSVKKADSLVRNMDGAAHVRNKEILTELAEKSPEFADILNKREIWKASNQLSGLVPTTVGGYGSGAGRANQLRGMFTGTAAGAGFTMGGAPGAVIGGGLATLGLAPRTAAGVIGAGRMAQQAGRFTTKATARQVGTRAGLDRLGL